MSKQTKKAVLNTYAPHKNPTLPLCLSSFSVKDTIDFLDILLDLLLFGPRVPQRLGHLVALVGGQLGLLGGHHQVVIDQLLADAELFGADELALPNMPVDLHVVRRLHLVFRLFGLRALLDPPRRRLDRPE